MISPVIITIMITTRENRRDERCENYRGHKRSLLHGVHSFFSFLHNDFDRAQQLCQSASIGKTRYYATGSLKFPENHSSELVNMGQSKTRRSHGEIRFE